LSVTPEGPGIWDFDVSSQALDPIISMQVSTNTPAPGQTGPTYLAVLLGRRR
jgi:hypothetical protein